MIDIIHDWNPWWDSRNGILSLKGSTRRDYLEKIMRNINGKHIISISGIRRSGKTTLIYQIIDRLLKKVAPENICYMNLDDERLVGFDEPLENFLKEYRRNLAPEGRIFIFLDEVQSVPGWERWIKRYYDLGRNIKFVVSGSSSSLVFSDYSSLLSGRNINIKVDPLSFREYLTFKSVRIEDGEIEKVWRSNREREDIIIHHLENYMKTGGFPEIVSGSGDHGLLKQYFSDILYRDIIKRHNVRYPDKLELLAVYALKNYSNLMSLRRIGQASGLSPDTVNEYLGYLEQSYLLFRSRLYSRSSLGKMRTNVPMKIYATDLGMANSLRLEPMETIGRWAENLLAKKVEKDMGHCFYWRERKEVDLILPEMRTAIQVNYGSGRENEMRALDELPYGDFRKTLITRDEYDPGGEIPKIPLWTRLLSEGWR